MQPKHAMLSGMGKGRFWTFDRVFNVANGAAGLLLAGVGVWFTIATYYREQPATPAPAISPSVATMTTPWWPIALLVMGVALLLAQVGLSVWRWKRGRTNRFEEPHDPDWEGKLEHIDGRYFEKETVLLDGKKFTNCTFKTVTFKFNGGPISMNGNHLFGPMNFTTDNPQIGRMNTLLLSMGVMRHDIISSKGRQSFADFATEKGIVLHPSQTKADDKPS